MSLRSATLEVWHAHTAKLQVWHSGHNVCRSGVPHLQFGNAAGTKGERIQKWAWQDNRLKQLTKGSAANIIGAVISSGFRYISIYFLVRGLGSMHYGVYVQTIVLFEILRSIGQCGLPQGVSRHIAIYHLEDDRRKIWAVILSSLLITLTASGLIGMLLCLFAETVSVRWFKTGEMTEIITQLWWLIPLNSLFFLIPNFFTGLRQMRYRTYVADLYQSGVWLLMVIIFCFWRPDLLTYFWGRASLFSVGLIFPFFILKKIVPLEIASWSEMTRVSRELFLFSLPLLLTTVINRVLFRVEILFLAYYLDPGQVAVYHVASRLSDIQNVFLLPVNTAFSPHSARLAKEGRFDKLNKDFKRVCQWLLIIALPVSLVFVLFPEELLAMFDPDFASGKWVLVMIILANLFNISTGPAGIMLSMAGYPKIEFFNALLVGVFSLFLNIKLIPLMGLMGAAIAIAAGVVLINSLRIGETFCLWRIFPYTIHTAKIMGIGFLVGVGGYALIGQFTMEPLFKFALGSLSTVALFFVGVFFFVLTKEEREWAVSAKKDLISRVS